MKTSVLLLVLCLGLTACVGQNSPTPAREEAMSPTASTTSSAASALEGKRWVLRSLQGQPAQTYPNQPEVNVVFAAEAGQGRVSGSDGCNLLVGSYTADDTELHFLHMGTTMMLCPNGADQSRSFLKTLGETSTWKLNGTRLELLNQGKVIAVFEGMAG